jgi:hypothetical protein
VKPAEDPYRAIEFGLPLPPARPILLELERTEFERAPTIALGTPMEIVSVIDATPAGGIAASISATIKR